MRPCPRCRAPLQNCDATCPHCGATEVPAPLDTRDPTPIQDTPSRVARDFIDLTTWSPFGTLLSILVVALVVAVGFAVAGQIGAFVAIVGAAVLWFVFVLWAERE